ncbi:hypothetical protein [Roseomonas sp. USHLN139]|uniref:hypothetical protein n=1 Tax=Roseomonas sp. USHLN139 TaxID=3081298 RepID=UPI003B018138
MTAKMIDGVLVPMDEADLAQMEADRLAALSPVPQVVSRAQAMDIMAGFILPDGRALDTAMDEVTLAALAATDNLPDSDPDRIEAKRARIWWLNAQTFERRHARLVAAQTQFGLSEAQVDAMFRAAIAV